MDGGVGREIFLFDLVFEYLVLSGMVKVTPTTTT